MLVCAWVCVCVCATPRSHCHYRGEACEHAGHMTEPCSVGHTQNGNMQNTMQRVQHRNLCRHCLCTGNVFLTQPVTFYYILSCTTIHFLYNLLSARSRSVKSILATVWPVNGAASSAPLPAPPSVPHLSPPRSWLLFAHHSVWRRLPRFCPIPSRSQMKIIWLWTLQNTGCRMVLFISPIIGVRKIHVVGSRITCNHII